MIKDKEFLFGPVFLRLFEGLDGENIAIRKYKKSRSSFVLNDKVGIYLKTSTSRGISWQFTFLKVHQEEIQELRNTFHDVFLILICNEDGIVSLNFNELKEILNHEHFDTEWIKVKRKIAEKYSVIGSDGELKRKIGDNEFPKKVIETLKK